MPADNIEKQINALIKDDNFIRLSKILNEFNIFKVLGIIDMEIKHSNILAWLLNPNESHQLNNLFLNEFIKDAHKKDCEVERYGQVIVKREWKDIDIIVEIEKQKCVFIIENKIWSKQHGNQLEDYEKKVYGYYNNKWHKNFIYLVPDSNREEDKGIWKRFQYSDISKITTNCIEELKKHVTMINEKIIYFLEDYQTILKRYIMGNDEKLVKLTQEIWQNHKEALEYLIKEAPNILDFFADEFKEKLKSENITFLPNKKLDFQTEPQIQIKKTSGVYIGYYIYKDKKYKKIDIKIYLAKHNNENKAMEIINSLAEINKIFQKSFNNISSLLDTDDGNIIYTKTLVSVNNIRNDIIDETIKKEFNKHCNLFFDDMRSIDNKLKELL